MRNGPLIGVILAGALTASAQGQVVIFENPLPGDGSYYAGQDGVEAIDDIHAVAGGNLTQIEVGYFDPDLGGGPLTVTVRVYANPTGQDNDFYPLAGPYVVGGLARGSGTAIVPLGDVPFSQKDLWIGVQFDSATAGVQLNAAPSTGSSHDYYLESSRFLYFGGDPVANFSLRVFATNPTAADEATAFAVVSPLQVSPNPFNPRTEIRFELDRSASVQLELFDLSGRKVRTLLDERRPSGPAVLSWNGRDDAGRRVASGVYVLRLLAEGTQRTRLLTLVE